MFISRFITLFKKFLGLALVLIGLLSLFVPFVPGILLIFIGLWLFGGGNYFKKWLKKTKKDTF